MEDFEFSTQSGFTVSVSKAHFGDAEGFTEPVFTVDLTPGDNTQPVAYTIALTRSELRFLADGADLVR